MESTPSTTLPAKPCKTCKQEFVPRTGQHFCPGCTAAFKAKQGTAATKPAETTNPAGTKPAGAKPAGTYHQKLPCSTSGCKGKQKCAFLTQEGYAVGFCYGCLCTKLSLKPTETTK